MSKKNRRMVQIARQFGASAKFTGSGGAIIGTYCADTFDDMRRELKKYDIEVRFNMEINAPQTLRREFDEVIVSTGATPKTLPSSN